MLQQSFEAAPQTQDAETPTTSEKAAPAERPPERPPERKLPTPKVKYDTRTAPPKVERLPQSDAVPAPPPVASIARAALPAPKRVSEGSVADLITRSEDDVPVTQLIDELLDELVYQLGKEDARTLSPMAVRWVKLSPNLRADLAQSIETRLSARLVKSTEIAQVVCTDCRAMRSRVEGRDWVVSLGAVHQADLRQIADDIGAKTFLDVDLQFIPGPPENQLTLAARAFRSTDARVLFASAIRADDTTAAVLRTGKKVPSREEQLAELERKLEQRPYYGLDAYLGAAWIPYDAPGGGVQGASVGVSVYERFGRDRRNMYGLQGEGFINPFRLLAGSLEAVYTRQMTEPDLNKPELRVWWGVGGFISGTEGNTMILESGADYVMKFRFSLGASLFYMVPVKFANYDLGGFGPKARFAFNW
jgi:hypothetical protein